MSESFAQIYLHIVFSTKQRRKYLQNKLLREEVHRYLGGTCQHLKSPSLIVGGVDDHTHILCRLSRTQAVSELVRELKRESSKWLKSKTHSLPDFPCQNAYGPSSLIPT